MVSYILAQIRPQFYPTTGLSLWQQQSYQITQGQGRLPIISCGGASWSQAGGGVGSEVHLLGQVEDGDVVVHDTSVIFRVNNQLLHFQLQLGQISLAFFVPIVFSECDLMRKYFQTNNIDEMHLYVFGFNFCSRVMTMYTVSGSDDVLGGHQCSSTG